MAGFEVDLDTTQVSDMVEMMRSKLTPGEFKTVMGRSLGQVARSIRRPISQEVRKKYAVKDGFVRAGFRSYRLEDGSGGNMAVRIPMKGPKGTVGGTFAAKGGHYGYNPPKYQIRVKILKGKESILPDSLSGQGGNPPFRNTRHRGFTTQKGEERPAAGNRENAGSFGDTVMTRTKQGRWPNRWPIKHVSALAMPQMPLNQARPETEKVIVETLENRIERNFGRLFDK